MRQKARLFYAIDEEGTNEIAESGMADKSPVQQEFSFEELENKSLKMDALTLFEKMTLALNSLIMQRKGVICGQQSSEINSV